MQESKSMGGALVDVFDAGLTLVKAEINNVGRKVGEVAKAKGIGVVLLLAAVGPLLMGLIFLILMLFYGLMALGLPAWASALLIALLSFVLTGALVMLGIQKLAAEVDTHEPLFGRDELGWAAHDADTSQAGAGQTGPFPPVGTAPVGTVPVSTATYAATAPRGGERVTYTVAPETLVGTPSAGIAEAAGHATDTRRQMAVAPNADTVADSAHHGAFQATGHGHEHDPNIQRPVVLEGQPGIRVSTEPTFREDMSKEGY